MNNNTKRNKADRLYSKRNRPGFCGLLVAAFILCSCGTVYGFSAEVGDTCSGVAVGGFHTCVLNSEGNIYCYGANNYGQAEDYTGGNAVGVSTGHYHTCVLLGDGNVDCYGYNRYGQAEDYTGGDAVSVSAGFYHTCILNSEGNVYCYGANNYGQAEDYTGGDAVEVTVGLYHTCILNSEGNVDCYGQDRFSQAEDYVGGDAVGVSAGFYHTCIINSEGNTYCYGANSYGQAEDYAGGDSVGSSGGGYHTCVLLENGNVDCYGYNWQGQAEGYTGEDAVGVSAGYYHTCVLTTDGYLNCFGLNNYGQAENYYVGDAVCRFESTNQPPVFDPIDPINAVEYDFIDFALTATDPDGDNFDYACEGLPAGSVFDANNGTFSWVPSYDQAGTYFISCLVTDDGSPQESGQLSVMITVNDIGPSALVNKVIDIINSDVELPHEVVNSYLANLKEVNEFIGRGKITPAINQLNAFIKKTEIDIKKGRVSADEGLVLIDMANDIKSKL